MASFVKLILSIVGPTLFRPGNAIGDVPGVNAANAAHADESKV